MPPNLGVSDAAIVAAVARWAARQGGARPGGAARYCGWSTAPRAPDTGSPGRHARVRRPGPPRPGPGAAADSAVLLKNDGCHPAAAPGRRADLVAVIGEFARTPRYQGTGSSQVNPDPARRATRRAERGAAGCERRPSPPGSASTTHRPTTDLAADAVAPRPAGRHGRRRSSACHRAEESEGFDRQHMDLPPQPDRTCWPSWPRPPASASSWSWPTARRSRLSHLGPARRRPCSNAGSPARPPAAATGRPALRRGQPVRPAGRDPTRSDCRTTRRYLNFPGEEGHVRYGEGRLRRLPRLRRRRPWRQLPLRPRPVLHHLRLRRPAGHRCRRRGR